MIAKYNPWGELSQNTHHFQRNRPDAKGPFIPVPPSPVRPSSLPGATARSRRFVLVDDHAAGPTTAACWAFWSPIPQQKSRLIFFQNVKRVEQILKSFYFGITTYSWKGLLFPTRKYISNTSPAFFLVWR